MEILKRIFKILLLGLLFCKSHTSEAQIKEFIEIKNILKDELKRADIKILESEIALTKIDKGDLHKYDLNDKPIDAFYIKSNDRLIDIKSESIAGLRNGAYWYLQQLGFRYYFPGENWTYIPDIKTPFWEVEKTISPSFLHRRIWYAYGTGSKQADQDYKKWFQANMLGGEGVNTGHSYDGIVSRNKSVFLNHPEYFAQKVSKGTIPRQPKFDVSNEALVQLVIKDAFSQIEASLKRTGVLPAMISMDPSDGGGFATNAAALKIGSPSEQVFYLANRVAIEVKKKYNGVKIGLYAYNFHANPPLLKLESNIVVLIATTMSQSKFRLNELIGLWQKKGVSLGIRDYLGVIAWDWDMPGKPNGAKISYVNKIKEFYAAGSKYYSAETNNGWISRGLGHYIAASLLMNINSDINQLEHEFYVNMFGKANQHMKKMFSAWLTSETIPLDGQLYDWFNLIKDAETIEQDKKIKRRFLDIKKYLHFVVLYKKWRMSNAEKELIALLNYCHRIIDKNIVASYALTRRIAITSKINGKLIQPNNPTEIWKTNSTTLTNEEVEANFDAAFKGLNKNERNTLTTMPEHFSIKLFDTGSKTKKLSSSSAITAKVQLRGIHRVIINVPTDNKNIAIFLKNGLIKSGNYKSLIVKVYKYVSDIVLNNENILFEEVVDARSEKTILLNTLEPGNYIVQIDDAKSGFTLGFTNNIAFGILVGNNNKIFTLIRSQLYFNVDENISLFKVNNKGVVTLISPTGRIINLQKKTGITDIQVLKNEIGLWQIKDQRGELSISGILPLVSTEQTLLSIP